MPFKDPEKAKEYKKRWRKENRVRVEIKRKAHYQKNREKILAHAKKYREENSEKIKAYKETSKEKIRAKEKRYYEENRERLIEEAKQRNKKNAKRVRENNRKWRNASENQERMRGYGRSPARRAMTARRRHGVRDRTPPWADHDAIKQVYKEAKEMEAIFGVKFHVDHIIPLHGGNVSGLHVAENLQVLEAETNIKKGIKYD